jgi:hypothetical protein
MSLHEHQIVGRRERSDRSLKPRLGSRMMPGGRLVGALEQDVCAGSKQPVRVFTRPIKLDAMYVVLDDGDLEAAFAESRDHRLEERGLAHSTPTADCEHRKPRKLVNHGASPALQPSR